MLPALNINNHSHIANRNNLEPAQEHLFTNVMHNNQRYRVLTQQCKKTISALKTLQVFWAITTIVQISAIIQNKRQFKQLYIIFGVWFFANLWATILAIKHRKIFIRMLTFSLFNLSIYLFICTIITGFFLGNKILLYPTFFYIISQILGSLILLQNRSKLFPKVMYLLQLLLIILKLDNRVQCQWIQVYFGFLLVFFIAVVVVISMLVFIAINFGYFQQRINSIKNVGIGFISINGLAIQVGAMLPLAQNFFGCNIYITGAIAIMFNILLVLYGRRFQSHIVLFMCRVQKIKSYNQYISLVKIPNQAIQAYVFVKKSQSWYQRMKYSEYSQNAKLVRNDKLVQNKKESSDSTLISQIPSLETTLKIKSQPQANCQSESETKHQQSSSKIFAQFQNKTLQILQKQFINLSPQNQNQQNKCLICLQLEPCMIWMPCGHLTVCQICCDKMLQNKNCNCLLCKDIPQAIYCVEQIGEQYKKKSKQRIKQIEINQIQNQQQNQNQDQNQNQKRDNQSKISTKIDINSKKNLTEQIVSNNNYHEDSISGKINHKQQFNKQIQKISKFQQNLNYCNKGQILKIRNAYSVRIT